MASANGYEARLHSPALAALIPMGLKPYTAALSLILQLKLTVMYECLLTESFIRQLKLTAMDG